MCFSTVSQRGRSRFLKTVPVPRSVPAKMVPTVPVSGSGSAPGPPCFGDSREPQECGKQRRI